MSTIGSLIRDANSALIEEGNVGGIANYFGTNYIVNFGSTQRTGHGAVRGFTKAIHESFSALSVDVEILVESGDRISWQRHVRGTQTGAFQGFPACGREISWRDMVVSRIENRKIAEEWVVSDLAEALLRARKR